MASCDLCGDSSSVLHPIRNVAAGSTKHLCGLCIKDIAEYAVKELGGRE